MRNDLVMIHFADEYYHWGLLNTFWTTKHDFRPEFSSFLFKRYSIAATFLNVYPFAGFLFFKLCIFLMFTAFDTRFNFSWNMLYGLYYVVVICLHLKNTSHTEENQGSWLKIKNIEKWITILSGEN